MSRRLTRLLAVAALALLPAAVPAPAHAAGTAGYCKDASGTTVVVDFTALGGDVVVRCSARAGSSTSGVEALQAAGLTVTGTAQYGTNFVCRIAGRPGPEEELAVQGDEGYQEDCNGTPPENARWGYWQARNGGSWRYSQTGAGTSSTTAGGFEGWRFLMNGDSSVPAAKPKRPGSSSSTPDPTSRPTPRPTQGPGGRGGSTGSATPTPSTSPTPPGASASPDARSGSSKDVRDRAAAPAAGKKRAAGDQRDRSDRTRGNGDGDRRSAPAPVAGPSDGPTVTGEIPEAASAETTGSATTTLLGVGALVVLGLGVGAVAWRRSRTR